MYDESDVVSISFHLPESLPAQRSNALQLYRKLFATGKKLLAKIHSALGFKDSLDWNDSLESTELLGLKNSLTLDGSSEDNILYAAINTLSWMRTEVVKLPKSSKSSGEGHQYGLVKAGAFGSSEVEPLPTKARSTKPSVKLQHEGGVYIMSNENLTVMVENGCITSLIDTSGIPREVIPKGSKANQFVIFDDKPLNWQAWDVEVYHLNTRRELVSEASEILESSDQRVSVISKTKISEHSWVKSTISLSVAVCYP